MSNFNDVSHKPLQAYNRAVMFYNIYEDEGRAAAEEYANQFSIEDRTNMARVVSLVKRKGVKYVKDAVTKGLDFPLYSDSNIAKEFVAG